MVDPASQGEGRSSGWLGELGNGLGIRGEGTGPLWDFWGRRWGVDWLPIARPGPGGGSGLAGQLFGVLPAKGLVVPDGRDPTEEVAVESYVTDGRERQVGGYELPSGDRQFPHEPEADAGRLFGVVFETVVPLGMFE